MRPMSKWSWTAVMPLDDQYADKEPAIRIQTHFKDGRMSETDCLILRAGCCQPARQVGSPCISINKDLTYTNLAILYFRLLADIYTTYLQTFSTIHFFLYFSRPIHLGDIAFYDKHSIIRGR